MRTGTELVASYDSALPFNEADMLGQWEFDNLSTTGEVLESVSGNNLTLSQTTEPGFYVGDTELVMGVFEDADNGTVVGTIEGVDPEREALIQSLFTSYPNLHYVPGSNVFVEVNSTQVDWDTAQANATSSTLNGANGFLSTISSASENEQVRAAAEAAGLTGIWLGASDSNTEGQWQ